MPKAVKIHGSMIQFKVPHYLAEGVEATAKRLKVSSPDLLRYLLDFSLGFIEGRDQEQIRQLVAQRQIDLAHNQAAIDIKKWKPTGIESDLVTSFSVIQSRG